MESKTSKPMFLSGRQFSKKEISQVRETVKSFSHLSRNELVLTLCEHLSWKTKTGSAKIISCNNALEKLEKQGFFKLPAKRKQKKREIKAISISIRSEAKPELECELKALMPIELSIVKEAEEVSLWNEYVERYHYLGYKHPIGTYLRYFIRSQKTGQILGCLIFSSSPWALADRDQWIGWTKKDRKQRLNLVINNNRFLILPWVKVNNLASKALSLASKQIQKDWKDEHNYSPVLLETFVDTNKYEGTCYRAANWKCIGQTSGIAWRDGFSEVRETSVKNIFLFPLQSNFRAILKNEKQTQQKTQIQVDEKFLKLWGNVVSIIAEVAFEFDQTWQKRKRIIDSLLLILLIFRLLFSKNNQGYATTISDFWFNCRKMNFNLPQKKPISASSFSEARGKLDEELFKVLNKRIINAYEQESEDFHLWNGHRVFAVDGSKINLPRQLINRGYKIPTENTHYPQGLLSCLYQLKSKTPYDFDLTAHSDERKCARQHLKVLKKNDIVVYDRGYFSYAMLYYHGKENIFPVFRLQRNLYTEIETFWKSERVDEIVTITPSKETSRDIKKKNPDIGKVIPLKLRLLKYEVAGTTYCLATTLFNPLYEGHLFKDLYHARWGIEELYKISKQFIEVEDFHGKTERGVKQELFAHFVLITMSRLCANESENLIANFLTPQNNQEESATKVQINFKNCLATISRHLEEMMAVPTRLIKNVMDSVISSISRVRQKTRDFRSYPRKSMKPIKKFRVAKIKKTNDMLTAN